MKKILYLLLLITTLTSITSCKKERVYQAGHFVGHWKYEQTGSITLYHAGQIIGSSPIDETGSWDITKSGKNAITIDNKLFTLNGNEITATPENVYNTENGFNMVGTVTYWGTVSHSIISIKTSITGTWSSSDGDQGTFSGKTVMTLKRND